jgi:hypothetical protein
VLLILIVTYRYGSAGLGAALSEASTNTGHACLCARTYVRIKLPLRVTHATVDIVFLEGQDVQPLLHVCVCVCVCVCARAYVVCVCVCVCVCEHLTVDVIFLEKGVELVFRSGRR